MTGTITPVVDLVYRRVGVTLSGWVSPANGPITVRRVHPDTTEWVVRGFGATSGGAAFAYDYEAPFGKPVTYYAFDGSTKVVGGPVTVSSSEMMLRAPGLPSLDVTLEVVAKPRVAYARPTVVLRPLGRATGVPLSSTRSAGEFTLAAETYSDTAASALLACVTQAATCLLVLPGVRNDWQYVAVTDVVEDPFAAVLRSVDGDVGSWAQWTLTCAVVDPPVGGVFGDPTASYQRLLDTYPTYQALLTAKGTYLDVLKGV